MIQPQETQDWRKEAERIVKSITTVFYAYFPEGEEYREVNAGVLIQPIATALEAAYKAGSERVRDAVLSVKVYPEHEHEGVDDMKEAARRAVGGGE